MLIAVPLGDRARARAAALARAGVRPGNVLMLLPLVTPELVFAVGMFLLFTTAFSFIGLGTTGAGDRPRDVLGLLRRADRARAAGDDRPDVEEAAADLGAPPHEIVRRVLLPLLAPAMVASPADRLRALDRRLRRQPSTWRRARTRRRCRCASTPRRAARRRRRSTRWRRSCWRSRCSRSRSPTSSCARSTAAGAGARRSSSSPRSTRERGPVTARRDPARGPGQALRRRGRRRRHRPAHPGGRVLHDARPVGLRQDDDAAADRGLRAPGRGRDPARRRRHVAHAAAQAARQHGVPELRAVPAQTVRGEHRLRPALPARPRRPRRAGASARRWRWCASTGSSDRRPGQLSGGQQQRVALARALVLEPPVLLLDEPLGALDARLRVDLQVELKRIQEQLGVTFVYVTHDQDEALTMSDRVAVMRAGRIEQCGDAAATLRGAGDGVRGELPRRLEPDPGDGRGRRRRLPARRSAPSTCARRTARVVERRRAGDDPARARAAGRRTASPGENRVPGMVEEVVYLGFHQRACACAWRPARWSRPTCPTTATVAEYEQGDPVAVHLPARQPARARRGRRR